MALAAILAAAALLRLCNLGTFSLALDEVFTVTRAALPFGEMIAACAADADNVPIYLVITFASMRLGLAEPWIRLVPIAAGLLSIIVWATWTRRRLGPAAGLLLAGFLALSPFHVRYSQELRAYPYLLLLAGLVMLAADRLRRRPTAAAALLLAALVALGWYTHFSFGLVVPSLVGLVLLRDRAEEPGGGRPRRALGLAVGALVAGTLAFLPWVLHVAETLERRMSRGANEWTLEMVARRWQFLTVASHESDAADWLGLGLMVLAAAGLATALRLEVGRKVLLPAVAAVVLGEAALVAVNRWSQGRYDTAVWPLLVLLIVLGAQRLGALLPGRRLRAAVLALAAVAMVARVDAYHRRGRPHWDRAAQAVVEARRPGELVLAESRWAATCLGFYLDQPVVSLDRKLERLAPAIRSAPSVLILVPRRFRQLEMQRVERQGGLVADVPGTGWLVRLRPDMLKPSKPFDDGSWPEPTVALVDPSIEASPPGCLARWTGADRAAPPLDWSRLELDEGSKPALRSGWSPARFAHDGATFRLIHGREAGVVVERTEARPTRVRLHLWPVRSLDEQQLRLLVNDHVLGTKPLVRARQTVAFEAPAEVWRAGRNLIVLQLRSAADPGDGRSLPRSAAVDWIALEP